MDVIRVLDWWDVFTFTGDNQLECPDCDTQSEPLPDIYAAALWVQQHSRECPA